MTGPARTLAAISLAAFILGACSLPLPATSPAGTATLPPQPPTPTATPATEPEPESATLILWVAPPFAPDPDTAPGAFLLERLHTFEEQVPGVQIQVRVKSREGRGGLVESLLSASQAAPETLPDLITLDPDGLRTAASHGLMTPLDTALPAPETDGWYEYALVSTTIEGEFLAVSFGAQTEAFAYRSDLYKAPPRRWADLLSAGNAFVIPAGDPEARFTLAQYLALGGRLTDDAGEPLLQADTLAKVLDFYRTALDAGLLPITVGRISTAQQSWEELLGNRTTAAVAPLETLLGGRNPERHAATAWPSGSDTPIALAEPWSWSIVYKSSAQEALAGQLLKWLMDPAFLGPWTQALGMLPPNSESLAAWPEGPEAALVSGLVTVARPLPGSQVRAAIGPALQSAISSVLNGLNSPAGAARQAADSLSAR